MEPLIALLTLFDGLFWREVPVDHPDGLVGISSTDGRMSGNQPVGIPQSLFTSLEGAEQVFDGFAAFVGFDAVGAIGSTSQHLTIQGVTGRYFETLGFRPELGRTLGPADDERAAPVVVISFRTWKSRFESAPDVVGKTFRLQGEFVTVVGIAASGFTGLQIGVPSDAWVPASLVPQLLTQPPDLTFFDVLVGRLRPGAGLHEARLRLESLWIPARQSAADIVGTSVPQARDLMRALEPRVEPAATGFSPYRDFYRRPLALLVLASFVTVLLACVNLSGLLLARWSAREADLSVQSALGASMWRLVSQVFAESLAVALLAVALSTPIALGAARGLTVLLWSQTAGLSQTPGAPLDLSVDYRILGVLATLVGLVALCVSVLPVCRILSGKLTLARAAHGTAHSSVARWGQRLVAAQIALSVPLVVAAWLVAANLHHLQSARTGFQPDGVVVAYLTSDGSATLGNDPRSRLVEMSSALRTVPGFTAAALCWREPVSGNRTRRPVAAADGLHAVGAFVEAVSPGYFDTLSIPILAGRDLTWTDDGNHGGVALVSAGLAQAVLPRANPVGRHIRLGDDVLEVVGVVADARLANPHETNQQFVFTALLQQPRRLLELQQPLVLLKSSLPSHDVQRLAHRTIVGLGGGTDLFDVHPLQRTLQATLLRERLIRMGAFYFAGVTTVLVFIGLQAVLVLGIAGRIPEIGLRMALGASASDVYALVTRQAVRMVIAGLAAGIPLALLSGRLVAGVLTVEPNVMFAAGVAITTSVVVAVLALVFPLRLATRIAPADALRGQ